MKIIGTKRIAYCDSCERLDDVVFTVKGLFKKHNWCYYCLRETTSLYLKVV